MTAVRLVNVRAGYNGRPAILDVDLTVETGGWVTLIGPNGAGKSTVLRVVAGLLAASGEVEIAGRPITAYGRREMARVVAFVPQQPILPQGMTILEYVLLGRTPYLGVLQMEGPADRSAAMDVLERLDLGPLAARPLDRLSGGEVQRAVLARALVQGARIMLLDEPTASLDIGHGQQVMDLVEDLRREGMTVLAAMHDLTLAAEYSDRLVLLTDGRAVAEGTPTNVITPERIERYYRARVTVVTGPGGTPVVVPLVRGRVERPMSIGEDPS